MPKGKKGLLTSSGEWAKHLRPFGKKVFWSGEREAEKQLIDDEIKQVEIYEDTEDFLWCLVGNIADEIEFGENKELRKGNKQFRPGAKVYCFPPLWGDGYESIKVIGLPRKSKKLITIIIPSKHITNWRKQKVFNPFIINTMIENNGWNHGKDSKRNLDSLYNSIIKTRN